MKQIHEIYTPQAYPLKVLQFGEGNFLRAFADYAIDIANEENDFQGSIAIIIPRSGKTNRFANQEHLYTVCLRGQKDGATYIENRVITSIHTVLSARDEYDQFIKLAYVPSLEFVISNTTEAGIVFDVTDRFDACPPVTFPGKLTKFLYERFLHFHGDETKGLIILPTELNDHNGKLLAQCVKQYGEQWQLGEAFNNWLQVACQFIDTLVDRIVTGYPGATITSFQEELGYEDSLLTQAEPFSLWVIGNPDLSSRFPIHSSKFQAVFTDNIKAFKEQKVRILNGAHTSMVLGAYLAGLDYVGQCMSDAVIRKQLDQTVFGEIVPTVHLPREKSEAFAKAVYERFENPFVKHALLSISLNSVSKWRARILPTLKDSLAATGTLPKWLTFSLAALLAFYRSTESGTDCLIGTRVNNTYEIHDDDTVLQVFQENSDWNTPDYVRRILSYKTFWGEDLTAIPHMSETVTSHLEKMAQDGVKAYIEALGNQA